MLKNACIFELKKYPQWKHTNKLCEHIIYALLFQTQSLSPLRRTCQLKDIYDSNTLLNQIRIPVNIFLQHSVGCEKCLTLLMVKRYEFAEMPLHSSLHETCLYFYMSSMPRKYLDKNGINSEWRACLLCLEIHSPRLLTFVISDSCRYCTRTRHRNWQSHWICNAHTTDWDCYRFRSFEGLRQHI